MDYLNKKEWHTGSIKNIAKVWQREQEELRKIMKQEEYKKKLQEEQHAHELKIAQVEAGLIPRSALDKMDWIYNPILGQQQQETEQYLLGKQVDLNNLPTQQKNQQDPQDNSNKYQAIVTEEVTNSTCENFTLIHEDPLFKMMQEEQKMKEKLMSNPLDMNLLMEEIRKQKELKKQINGSKKSKKKDKKDKKDKKKDKKNRHKDEKESKKKKNKSRSRSRSSHKSKKENGSQNKKDKKKRKQSRSPSSSSSRSSSSSKSKSKESRSKRSGSRSHKEKKLRQSKSRSLSPESKIKQMHYEEYLKKKVGNNLVRGDDGTLKVDFGLMKRKFRNNLKPEEKLKMTEEEKRERLKEMQESAKQVTQERLKEFKDDYKDTDNNDESNVKDLHGKQNNPKFLNDINKEIYIGKKDINALADQLSMNKSRLTRNLEEKNTFK